MLAVASRHTLPLSLQGGYESKLAAVWTTEQLAIIHGYNHQNLSWKRLGQEVEMWNWLFNTVCVLWEF